MKDLQPDVPTSVYDALWAVENDKVTYNEAIDMGNHTIVGLKTSTNDTAAVTYKQLSEKAESRYARLFEYWFDLLDPNMFNFVNNINGVELKIINYKFVLNSHYNIEDFDVDDGLSALLCRIHLDRDYKQNDNFTLFITFKHNTGITNSNPPQNIGFWTGATVTWFPPYVRITADKIYLYKDAKTFVSKDIPSNYKNKHLIIWFTKNNNEYSVTLCNKKLVFRETISSVANFTTNRLGINLDYNVQRIGFTSNVYANSSVEFHKILYLEKTKGVKLD